MWVRDAFEDRAMPAGVAGAIAGAATELTLFPLWIPIDVISQRIQVSSVPPRGTSVFQPKATNIIRDFYARKGIRGFYTGTNAYLLYHVPYAALSWGNYEILKVGYNKLATRLLGPACPTGSGARLFQEQVFSAATAAVITSCLLNPGDIIKTRIQSGVTCDPLPPPKWLQPYPRIAGSNVVRELHALLSREGYRGLLKGLGPRLPLAMSVMIVESVIFELALAISLKEVD
jgi:hypothetical protein